MSATSPGPLIKSLFVLALRLFAAALGLVLNMLLARYLGASGAGQYYIALTLIVFLSTLGALGFGTLLVRDVARLRDSIEGEQAQGFKTLFVTAGLFSGVLALLLAMTSPLLGRHVYEDPGLTPLLMMMGIAISPLVLLNLYSQALRGAGHAVSSFVYQLIVPASVVCIVIPLYSTSYGVKAVAVGYLAGCAIALACAALHFHRSIVLPAVPLKSGSPGTVLGNGAPFLLVDLMRVAMGWLPLLILGIFARPDEVGIFTIALRTSLIIGFILLAGSAVVSPIFARLYRQSRIGDMKKLFVRATTIIFLTSIAATGIMIAFSQSIMSLFGSDFLSGRQWLVLLAVGQCLVSGLGLNEVLLMMSGKEASVRNVYFLVVTAATVCGFVLVPLYGVLGAAITMMASWLMHSMGCALLVGHYYFTSDRIR